jgi:hypothetical protein
MREAIMMLNHLAGMSAFLMIPLLCFIAIIWRIQLRTDKVDELYKAIKESVVDKTNPDQKDLRALTKFRQFQKDIPEFKEAVQQKLKTYNLVPTTIEKTMSPVQLYKANNPLWITNLSVSTIKTIFILENKLGKDVVIAEHIDEFMQNSNSIKL